MSTPAPRLAPGTYKFTVKSIEQAVSLIREKLGPTARVLSVRSVEATGLKKLFNSPKLEVIAQIDAPSAESLAASHTPLAAVSSEPALPPSAPAPSPASRNRLEPLSPTLGLSGLLRRSGITESALTRLQAGANWNELNTLPLHRALAETSRLLRTQVEARPSRAPLSRAAFLGAPGVGRTTALCKWLAQEVMRRARLGHVVSVEFDRPNSLGPLPVFAEAMGVPLAHFPCETGPAVPNGFVYFDLPGLSPRRPADNAPLAAFLDRERIAERVLVLNAAYDRASLRDAYAAGRDLGATHLVFTHLDEVPQWGKLWDYLFDESLEPLFLGTGPSLTGDCEEDVPGAIVRRTLPEDHN
ncbi:MAG: flagellar GTP-binding protein [Verrucomicrobia bacterium]|nr:flagellar GTP-binding protein [Verrucomicrobiota bacterium]